MSENAIKFKPLWFVEPCAECGIEGQSTRGEPVLASKLYICEGCEMYARGFAEGFAEGRRGLLPGHVKERESKAKCPYCRNSPGLDISDGMCTDCSACSGTSLVSPGSRAYNEGVKSGLIQL